MKDDFKTLQYIFLGLFFGQLTFAVVANFMITKGVITDTGVLMYLVPAVMLAGYLGGNYIFNQSLKKEINTETDLVTKFKSYRKNAIIRWGMLEVGNMLAIVAAIVEGKTFYFALFAIGILLFSRTRPNIHDFCEQFKVSHGDARAIGWEV